MALTFSFGPLAAHPTATTNYRIEGPEHRILFESFPRRVRALFGGATVLDTDAGSLLHETNHLPVLYVPRADVREDLLEASAHTTHCPFKGDATYWSVRAGGRSARDAVWAYPEPIGEVPWLAEYVAFEWETMDAWFDEAEELPGHLRDPYHRIDVRDASRRVRVLVSGEMVAESDEAKVLSETGLPNRYYLPPADVLPGLLVPSATHTLCQYKGRASYRGLELEGRVLPDAAWLYPEPLEGAARIRDHVSFDGEDVVVEVEGTSVG